MRRGIRIPAWYLLLVAVLGILSKCESLRDLERFARRHHGVLTETLGIELKRPPSDSAFRYFFLQVDVASICAAIRDWTLAQIPGGATDLDPLICDGKTLRDSIEVTAAGGAAFIAQVTLYSAVLGLAIAQGCYATNQGNKHAELKKLLGKLDLGQGRLKVCPGSSWRACRHWVSSAGLTAPDARNRLRCSRSGRAG